MATITDNDLKMFQERARTEFSGCDVGGIAWDSVIWDLCNEVRRLRSVSKERGNAEKLREAVWLNGDEYEYEYAYCSICGRMQFADWNSHEDARAHVSNFHEDYKFCPSCGAKMTGGMYVEKRKKRHGK